MTAFRCVAFACAAAAWLAAPAAGQGNPFLKKDKDPPKKDEGWNGAQVYGKWPAARTKLTADDDDRAERRPTTDGPLWVLRDDGGRLLVRDGAGGGWVAKADYVRDVDTGPYFAGRIDADPKDAHAYKCRVRLALFSDPKAARADLDALARIAPKDPDALRMSAFLWETAGDYAKALKDCDRLVELVPDAAWPLAFRGDTRAQSGDLDGAAADLAAAIALEPKNGRLLVRRGEVHALRRAFDAQVADLDAALDLRSTDVKAALAARGLARANALDVRGGLQDLNDVLRAGPKSGWHQYCRACLLLLAKDAEAGEAFETIRDNPLAVKGFADFAAIYAHLAARQAGDTKLAEAALKAAAGRVKEGWPLPLVQYLEGDLAEAGVLKRAETAGQRTEARCAMGVHLMLKGDHGTAAEHFRWVKAKGAVDFADFTIAVNLLDRIEQEAKKK